MIVVELRQQIIVQNIDKFFYTRKGAGYAILSLGRNEQKKSS